MTRLLPYLILPLGVALLEYHGIQFWTVAVTGAWPGWFTVGFWLAWHAWGWPLLLEGGALWCWLQSRGEGWRGGGWSFGGGVLTIVLCAAALWNVAEPVRRNQAVTAGLEDERARLDAREDAQKRIAGQAVSPAGVPYKRPLDHLYRTQERSVELFNEWMALARAGKITTERQSVVLWWLQVVCVLLGQGLVVASARAVARPRNEHPIDRLAREQGVKPWTKKALDSILGKFPDFPLRETEAAPVPASEVYGIFSKETHGPLSSSTEGVEDAQAAAGVAVGERGEAVSVAEAIRKSGASTRLGSWESEGRDNLPTAKETAVPARETTESEPGAPDPAPDPAPGEPEGTTRAKAAWARIVTLWPMEEDQQRAAYLGISTRDMSLLRNHERLAEEKKTARHTKVISEAKLAQVERALARPFGDQPIDWNHELTGGPVTQMAARRKKLQPMEPV